MGSPVVPVPGASHSSPCGCPAWTSAGGCDDGRITDGQGRTVDFKNTVIIMTSNIGSQYITEEESRAARERLVMDALRAHFRPEFLNRVDEIIIFDRLSEDDLKKIVEIQLGRLTKRLAQQNITLELTDAAKALLAREGYDPVYGARPLKRVIQRELISRAEPAWRIRRT